MRPYPLALGLALTLLMPPGAVPQSPPALPAELALVGTLADDGPIPESSGVAVSRRFPDILWTHNDSGHEPLVYAIRPSGKVVARFRLAGARLEDWEDIALGPCPDAVREDCLFVGELGDNLERRPSGIIYVVREPDPSTVAAGEIRTVEARAVSVRLTDRPHDVEAVLVGPDGTVHLVTKGRTPPIRRYEIPRDAMLRDTVAVTPVQEIPIAPVRMMGRWVTGGAISPDGRRIVLRTYTELYFLEPGPDGVWALDGPACWLGPTEPQGEAVDFLDHRTLILTSESRPATDGTIYRVRC